MPYQLFPVNSVLSEGIAQSLVFYALALVTDEKSRNRILMTEEATERFVFFSCVAIGVGTDDGADTVNRRAGQEGSLFENSDPGESVRGHHPVLSRQKLLSTFAVSARFRAKWNNSWRSEGGGRQ